MRSRLFIIIQIISKVHVVPTKGRKKSLQLVCLSRAGPSIFAAPTFKINFKIIFCVLVQAVLPLVNFAGLGSRLPCLSPRDGPVFISIYDLFVEKVPNLFFSMASGTYIKNLYFRSQKDIKEVFYVANIGRKKIFSNSAFYKKKIIYH